jgi:hypothetical protein
MSDAAALEMLVQLFDSRCIPMDPSESRSNEREKDERHLSTSDATYSLQQ